MAGGYISAYSSPALASMRQEGSTLIPNEEEVSKLLLYFFFLQNQIQSRVTKNRLILIQARGKNLQKIADKSNYALNSKAS